MVKPRIKCKRVNLNKKKQRFYLTGRSLRDWGIESVTKHVTMVKLAKSAVSKFENPQISIFTNYGMFEFDFLNTEEPWGR